MVREYMEGKLCECKWEFEKKQPEKYKKALQVVLEEKYDIKNKTTQELEEIILNEDIDIFEDEYFMSELKNYISGTDDYEEYKNSQEEMAKYHGDMNAYYSNLYGIPRN